MQSVAIRTALSGAPFEWAVAELQAALEGRFTIVKGGGERLILLHPPGQSAAGVALPKAADAFAIVPEGGTLHLCGSTPRGLVYAALELAERVRLGDDGLRFDAAVVEAPVGKVRSLARFFCSEAEDLFWLHDTRMWCDYLTMLAVNRFSGFSLNFGLQYNYPYYNRLITDTYLYFPYPFLVDVPGSGVFADGLPECERECNLAMLRFIGAEAARRGLDFRIGLWTHGYDFDDVPNATYQIRGITPDNHAAYCRDALRMLIAAVPGLTGAIFRVHVEAGIPEGSYGFWQTVFEGMRDVGQGFTLDIHAKGTDQHMVEIALATGLPVTVSPKFMAEHSGLPYHQAAVREREMPSADAVRAAFRLSEGSRKFLRYGYGDLLASGRKFDVQVRVWPGTQRVLLGVDPALAAAYGRAGVFCGAAGIEFFEPLSMKGRMGSGRLGARFNYAPEELQPRHDWQKYLPAFALLGRLAYNPEASAETWMRPLREIAGAAAEACLDALAPVARVLPLVTQVHGVSACNNTYWPEMYDNMSIVYPPAEFPYGYDSGGATRFGDVATFDPQMFSSPAEFVAALNAEQTLAKFSPLDVARALDGFAAASETATRRAEVMPEAARAPVQRMLVDARMLAGLGCFFAARFRSAAAFELYLLSGLRDAYLDAMEQYRKARAAWLGIVQAADGTYLDDLSYGVQPWLRGNWRDRLHAIDRDIEDLEYWYINDRERHPADPTDAASVLERLRHWPGTASLPLVGKVPSSFQRGRALQLSFDLPTAGYATVRLHYRRVNQSERWQSVPMARASAEIPAGYTDTAFPLQFYASLEGPAGVALAPGFAPDWCSVPYAVAMPG